MTVRIGDITFSDWISLQYPGGWTDTFVFRISAQACLPPFSYAPLIKRLVAHVRIKRSFASIWVQVDAPGEWFVAEVRGSLRGLRLPFVVTPVGVIPEYAGFSFRPRLFHESLKPSPVVEEKEASISPDELRCLQALGRMVRGNEEEIAVLVGLPVDTTSHLLASLESRGLVVNEINPGAKRGKSKPTQMDLFPLWQMGTKGLSIALRSWDVPKGTAFTSRKEANLRQIGYDHRYTSRLWQEWLKSAWPLAEIWTGWSEVRIPGLRVIPDGLAWGRIQGYETLFWLEVGDGHKSTDKIVEITRKRLVQARKLCRRTGVRLVYTQLSTGWVHDAARWACVDLTNEESVVMGNLRKFGKLPMVEWGAVTPV